MMAKISSGQGFAGLVDYANDINYGMSSFGYCKGSKTSVLIYNGRDNLHKPRRNIFMIPLKLEYLVVCMRKKT